MSYDCGVQAPGLAQPPFGDGFGGRRGAGEDAVEKSLSGRHVSLFWISHQRCSVRLFKAPATGPEFGAVPSRGSSDVRAGEELECAAFGCGRCAVWRRSKSNLLSLCRGLLHFGHRQTGVRVRRQRESVCG